MALILAGLAGVIGFGCGGQQAGDHEIIIWDQMDPSESALLLEHLNAYEEEHPGIRILRSQYETEVLRTQFQTAATAGGGPDLVYGPSDQVGPFSVLRIIRPLDEIVPVDTLAQFHPASFDTLDGHLYALPDQLGNHLTLIFNKRLLATPPADLEELAQVARTHTIDADGDGRAERYGLVYNTSEPFWLVPFLGAYGGWVMDADHNPSLDSQAMIDALTYLAHLKNDLGVVPRECDVQLADTMFKEGKAAMIINGPWSLQAYREAGIDIGIARIPRHPTTQRWATPMIGSKGYSINVNVKDSKLPMVLDLLYALTSTRTTAEYAKLLILPSRNAALQEPEVAADPLITASRNQYDVGRRMPVVPEMRAVWDAMRPALQLVMNGNLDPASAATRMQKEAVEKIASMKR